MRPARSLVQLGFAVALAAPAAGARSEDCNGNGIDDALDVAPGAFQMGTSLFPAADFIEPSDLDGDGKLDLVLLPTNLCGTRLCPPSSLSVYRNEGSKAFSTALDYTFGSRVSLALVVADLNGDTSPDLVATSVFSNGTLEVLLSAGPGRIVAPPATTYPVPSPNATIAADINGDGDLDLAVAASFHVALLLNQGDGTFAGTRNTILGSGPTALVSGDFNADGKLDLTTANEFSGSLSILLGDGEGSFPSIRNYASGGERPNSLVTADFDGDGSLDLAAANWQSDGMEGSVSVLFNIGDGTFSPATVHPMADASSPHSLRAADTDLDGKLDLYASGFGGWLHLRNLGAQTFEAIEHVIAGAESVTVALANLDGAGKPDWAVGSGTGLTLSTDSRPETAYDFGGYILAAADLDGNGLDDLVLRHQRGVDVMWNEPGKGLLAPPVDRMTLSGGGQVTFRLEAAADLNADGAADLVLAKPEAHSVSVLLNQGGGGFYPAVDSPAGAYPERVVPADLDRDGKLDLATLGSPDHVSVLLGKGDGAFLPAVSYPVVGYIVNISGMLLTADLSRDGRPDLTLLSSEPSYRSYLSVLLGNGDGSFQPAKDYPSPGPVWASVITVDVNGDGALDLAASGVLQGQGLPEREGSISVLMNQGGGIFEAAVPYPVAGGAFFLATADFNTDGKPDLATASPYFYDALSVLLNRGDGTFGAASPWPVIEQAHLVLSADLNGDGHADLVGSANQISVLPGRGDGTFEEPRGVTVVDGPDEWTDYETLVVFDADLDGDLDLAIEGSSRDPVSQTLSASFVIVVLQGQGESPWSPVRLTLGTGPPLGSGSSFLVADLGGSDLPDLALLGEGDGVDWSLEVLLNQTRPPSSRDLDHDGLPDECERAPFHRGDPNGDGQSDISDAVATLEFLFLGGAASGCRESADINNDGAITITDPVSLLGFLFRGGPPPAEPGPPRAPCGPDPDPPGSSGDLGCEAYGACG